MDLVSYCTLDETNQTEYSAASPLNREPAPKDLVASFFTPPDLSYDRNHGAIPYISAGAHTLLVDGPYVSQRTRLSVSQLRTEFPQHEVECALECAGNRRHTMRTMLREVEGVDWGDGAVMNGRWRGPRVRDVLRRAGVRDSGLDGLHVAFSAYQVKCQDDDWFGGSVPLERCMREEGEAILALELNGAPLTPRHGYPVRAVLPGIAGARWVKWVDRVRVQASESPNFYQQRDYKVLPEEAVDRASAEKHWASTPAMNDMPINSVVAVPGDGETVSLSSSGILTVKGYAVPNGADGPVTRVQVSTDAGASWVDAELDRYGRERKWCWVLWEVPVCAQPGTNREIVCRAFDAGGNSQREHSQWNLRGVGYNGFGRARNLTILSQ